MKWCVLSSAVFFLFSGDVSADNDDVAYCRNPGTITTHMEGLWQDGWPNNQGKVKALCEGSVSMSEDGEICIEGRVTYTQIKESLGFNNIFAPAASTISVQGHLISGTGNAVLADEAYYLYDFISSYTINGTEYTAGPDIIDKMLAASMGTIDEVCFVSNFTQPEVYYQLTHKTRPMNMAKVEDLETANVLMGGKFSVTMEYHNKVEKPSGLVLSLSKLRMQTFNTAAGTYTPPAVLAVVPLYPLTGLLRQTIVGSSTFSTADYPQPLEAPDADVENIQVDAPWANVVTAMENGVFGQMPVLMGFLIKRISVSENTIGCWKDEQMASVDMQMPLSGAKGLDDYAENILLPALQELGEVSIHFGKRIPTGSNLLAAALTKFESCGASLNINPSPCYHPGCTRSTEVTEFEYPPEYTEFE